MKLVTSIEVTRAIDCWLLYAERAKLPKEKGQAHWQQEWDKDHADFFIGRVFPNLHMPCKVRRIAVEAYLAGMEAHSNGSTLVPESYRYGNTKDWQGVMHDYIFWLHSRGMTDASGYVWTLAEANKAYREAWIADGQVVRGWAWWAGLSAGSWIVWNRKEGKRK